MLMGITYVVQSATAVAGDMDVVKYIVYPIQDVVYLLVFGLIYINMRRNIAFLRECRRMNEIILNADLRRSVILKLRLMLWLLLFMTFYFILVITQDVLTLAYVKSDFERSVNRYIVGGFIEFAIVFAILMFLRAKREGRFFSIGFNRLVGSSY